MIILKWILKMTDCKLSFEFFPPKSESAHLQLHRTSQKLKAYSPSFFSVTFGAGGSTQHETPETVRLLLQNYTVAPHISCMGSSRDNLIELLDQYSTLGVKNLIVLRGDRPSGLGACQSDLQHASDLVALIKSHFPGRFAIYVAAYPECHPEAKTLLSDVLALKIKQDAGANSAITQYFYSVESYFHYRALANKQGINMPIIPGIMPIMDFDKLMRFSKRCEAEIPRWLIKQMSVYAGDPDSQYQLGLDVVTHLCEQLVNCGVEHLHFYTLNQSKTVESILSRLGVAKTEVVSEVGM